MSKLPSDATQLRNLKADIKKLAEAHQVLHDVKENFRIRATKAEHECAEWKNRFDVLVSKMPEVK
jgi:FtsZ-binding cell division protein ZapB